MDLLQLLNKSDLESLAVQFGPGLDEQSFVDVIQDLLSRKLRAATQAHSSTAKELTTAVRKWKPKAIRELFHTVDYNGDGTLQYQELTNFAINSALHHTHNQNQRVELQFRDYQVVLPPQPASYGSTTVVNAGNFSPLSEQILAGRGHFKDQSAQLKRLFYMRGLKRFVAEGFTRVTVHHVDSPDPISRLDIQGEILDVTTAHNHTYLVCATDQCVIEVFEQPTTVGISSEARYSKRKGLFTHRAVTQFLKSESGLGQLPGWFGGTGDREGLIRYCNMERLHAQLTLLGHHLDALTIAKRRFHSDEITSLQYINSRMGGESIISASLDNRIVVHDVETGQIRFEPSHAHRSGIRHMTLSNIHNLGFSTGSEPYASVFNLDYVQHTVIRLEDRKEPHTHKLVGVHCVTNTHQVITADAGGMLKLWDVRQLRTIKTFFVPPLEVDAAAVTKKLKHQRSYGMSESRPLTKGSHTEIQVQQKCALLKDLLYCDESRRIYAIGKETTVFQYDTSTLVPKAHAEPLVTIAYNPIDDVILTASQKDLKLWAVKTGCCVSTLHPLFVASDGSPYLQANLSSFTVDPIGGKRVFLGSSQGHVACVVPVTGKSEWCVKVRSSCKVPVVRIIVSHGKYLFVGFRDGFVASLEINHPSNIPKIVFEPGATSVMPSIPRADDPGFEQLMSPSTVHRKQMQNQVRRRTSRTAASLWKQAGAVVKVTDSLVKQQAAALAAGGGAATAIGKPPVVPRRSNAVPALLCESAVLQMFLLYVPMDDTLLGMEFGARACFNIQSKFPNPVTAACFVKESPWRSSVKSQRQERQNVLNASLPLHQRKIVRGDPDSCQLSLFAVSLADGQLLIFSIHMAEPASRLTTALLMSIDVLEGIAINCLVCVQKAYIVAGCDSNEVVVWQVSSLLDAASVFSSAQDTADDHLLMNEQPESATGNPNLLNNMQSPRDVKVVGDFLFASSSAEPPNQDDNLDIALDWERRMERTVAAIDALGNALPFGGSTVPDQTFVSHCVNIADTGIIACASGDLDSIVRIMTVDGDEIGLLAQGRTEDDAADAIASAKRNILHMRQKVEQQLLKRHREQEEDEDANNISSELAMSVDGMNSSMFIGDHSTNGLKRTLAPLSPRSAALNGSTGRLSASGSFAISGRGDQMRQHAVSPPRGAASPTSPASPGAVSPSNRGGQSYAPYVWDQIFSERHWRSPGNFQVPPTGPFSDVQLPQVLATSTTNGKYIPPALSGSLLAEGPLMTPVHLPQLHIDFTKIQFHHRNEDDEGWVRCDHAPQEGDFPRTQHMAELKKTVKTLRRALKRLEQTKRSEIAEMEQDCPEAVRRLANRQWEEEMTRTKRGLAVAEQELATLESMQQATMEIETIGSTPGSRKGAPTSDTGDPLAAHMTLPVGKQVSDLLAQEATTSPGLKPNPPSSTVSPQHGPSTVVPLSPMAMSHSLAGGGGYSFLDQTTLSSTSATNPSGLQAPPPAATLASLAQRRLSMRARQQRAVDTNPAPQSGSFDDQNMEDGAVAAVVVAAVSPSHLTRSVPLGHRHTDLNALPSRLVHYVDDGSHQRPTSPFRGGKKKPQHLSSPVVSELGACVPAPLGVLLDGEASDVDGDVRKVFVRSCDRDCGTANEVILDSTALQPPAAVPPLPLPLPAGMRHISPEQFRTNVELLDAMLRGGVSGDAIRSKLDDDRMVLHATGELSMRGWRLQEEVNAEQLRQNFKQKKAAERLRQKKAHLQLVPSDDETIAEGTSSPPSPTLVKGAGQPPKRSRASLSRVNELVFPPIVSPRKTLHFPSSTARTAEPVPDQVAGLLEVKRPAMLPPNPPLRKRQHSNTAR